MRLSDAERRARLVARHHLGRTAGDAVVAVRAVVALHSSDPATPYLALRARVAGFRREDLEGALYEERSLWRLHAMRRTLFVVAADEGPMFAAAAAHDVARKERAKLETWLAASMDPRRVPRWLAGLEGQVLDLLEEEGELATRDLAERVPELDASITVGSGKWTTSVPVSSRLLLVLAMEGRIVRTRPAGSWRSSQYRWSAAPAWFGTPDLSAPDPGAARAALTRRYLAAHGPATRDDVRWWTGWSARWTDAALGAVGAVRVELAGGADGFILADDLEPTGPPPEGTVALLPGLDPASMGWKSRGWYLGPHAEALFDRNGNAGPTIWVDGRVVGGWAQRTDGSVAYRLLEDVGKEAARTVEAEAEGLGTWMDGATVTPRFRTPLERELAAGPGRNRPSEGAFRPTSKA